MVRMPMQPILEIVRDRFWELSSLPFWPLSHSGGRGGKRRDGIQWRRVLRPVSKRTRLRILRERPRIQLLVRFRGRMTLGLRIGTWTSQMRRGGGPGVGRGQVAVSGLRASLGRRRNGRSEIEGGGEGGVWGGGVGVGCVGIKRGRRRESGVYPRAKLVILFVSRRELVRVERRRIVVRRANGSESV